MMPNIKKKKMLVCYNIFFCSQIFNYLYMHVCVCEGVLRPCNYLKSSLIIYTKS